MNDMNPQAQKRKMLRHARIFVAPLLAFALFCAPSAMASDALATPNPLGEVTLGQIDAPITVVEYASLTCSHCGDFHNNVLPVLKREYVDTGKVKFHFRPFPLDPFASAGAMLVQCVSARARTGFLDVLFARQNEWLRAQEPIKKLQSYARQIGMSGEEFVLCLQNQKVLDGIRDMQKAANIELGVESTPTFFINGEKVEGNIGVEKFRALIDNKIGAQTSKGGS